MFKRSNLFFYFVFSININAEFILYKKSFKKLNDKVDLLSYKTLQEKEKKDLVDLYKTTIYKYQWPMILAYYQDFSEVEKKEYLKALEAQRGLFFLIKNKIEKKSNNKYSVEWVPTTVFEMFSIFNCIKMLTDDHLSKIHNNEFKFSEQNLIEIYFTVFDQIINFYRIEGKFITSITQDNETIILKNIKLLGDMIKTNKKTHFGLSGLKQYDVYDDSMLPIIQKYLQLEQKSFENNMFLLSRGTNGYNKYRSESLVDYKLGSLNGISYGYSLFAGTIFERWYMSFNDPIGARSVDYILQFKIGYVLLIKIADAFNAQNIKNIFQFPILTTINGIFGVGEDFHPRLRMDVRNLYELEQTKIAQQLADYLSNAQFIKIEKNTKLSEQILKEDKEIQLKTILHKEAQKRISIEQQEMVERYENIFLPMIKEKDSLFFIPVDYMKFLDINVLKSLTIDQLKSLTPDQVKALRFSGQANLLTAEQRKILKI